MSSQGGETDVNGLSIPSWSGRRAGEALAKVKAEGRRRNAVCCICKQSIDYSLSYPHKQSCSVQHVKSRKLYPHLTWEPSNWKPAHLDCNKAAGPGEDLSMGITSEDW
jgi:5-methylcytosine-specific restriction endonuclease McrA